MSATTDYSNDVKHGNEFDEERSPTPTSEEYTDSEDEEASRDSISFSRIRLRDADSNLPDANNEDSMPTNFSGMRFDIGDNLSSSLPSTSEHEGRSPPDAANGTGSNNGGRKRTFSNSESSPKDTPTEKRTATKICRVCGDKAYSYNFNVITCESCKAFFRRNANKEKEIRCPFNDQCDINIVSRRFCQRCRLQKCFRVGMKKEWIMSEEARLEKKQRILDNRERRAAERMMEDKGGQGVQMSPEGNSNSMTNGDTKMSSFAAPVQQQPQQNGVSPPNTAVEELAAAIAAPVAVQQQAQAAVVAAALLQSAAPVTAPVIPAVPAVALMPPAPQPVAPTSEVAQYAAAVAAVAANAAANPAAVAPPASFPTHNDAGQMATERALAASILTNVAQPPGHELNVQAAQMVNPIAAVQLQQQVANYQAAQQVVAQAQAQAQAVNHIVQQQQAVAAAQQQQQQAAQQQQAQNLVAAVAAAASIVGSLESPVVTAPPPAMVTAASIGSVPQPSSAPMTAAQVSSPDDSNLQDLISVPRDILIKLIENRMESDQGHNPLNPPPVKCQCHCQCGRYPNELLIVDKVMTDLLENSTKYNNTRPMAQLSQKTVNNTTPIPMDTTPPLVQVQAPQAIMQPVPVAVAVPPQPVAPQMFAMQPMAPQMQQVMSAQQMQTAMTQPMSAQQIQTAMTQPMSGITNFAPMVTGMPSMHDQQQQQQQQQHQEYMYHQPSMQTSAAC